MSSLHFMFQKSVVRNLQDDFLKSSMGHRYLVFHCTVKNPKQVNFDSSIFVKKIIQRRCMITSFIAGLSGNSRCPTAKPFPKAYICWSNESIWFRQTRYSFWCWIARCNYSADSIIDLCSFFVSFFLGSVLFLSCSDERVVVV